VDDRHLADELPGARAAGSGSGPHPPRSRCGLQGAKRLIGRYIPSAKNRMVASHYQSLGFALVDTASDGATEWRLDLAGYVPPELPIRIEDSALPPAEADARSGVEVTRPFEVRTLCSHAV